MTETEIQDAISGHEARNKELLRVIESKGVNVRERHRTEHHFWAFSQDDAASLADELYKRGYLLLELSVHDNQADGSKYWNIEASFERTLAQAASHEVTEELVRLAANFDAEYDGWGVSVKPQVPH